MWVLQKLGGLNNCRWPASDPDKNKSSEKERTTRASSAAKATLQLTFQDKDGQLKSAIAPLKCDDSWVHSSVETRRSSKRVARISILPITGEEADESSLNPRLELRSSYRLKMRTSNDDEGGNRPPTVGGTIGRSPLIRRAHRAVTKCRKLKCKCCRSICPQVILILANFIFLVCGWGLIVSGVWFYLYQDTLIYSHLLSSNEHLKGQTRSTLNFHQIPLILITSGVFVASVSFLGCCGACSESVCFLGFYSILLLFVICAEILLALVTTQVMDHISLSTSQAMIEQLRNTYNKTADKLNNTSPEVAKVTLAWDHVQSKLKCCGVFGPRDYMKTSWFNHTDENEGNFVPPSCCMVRAFRGSDDDDDDDGAGGTTRVKGQSNVAAAGAGDDDDGDVEVKIRNYCQIESLLLSVSSNRTKNIHTQGCHDVFARWIDAHVGQFRCILVILITIQMVDFVSAWCLLAHLKRKQSEYWWCDDDDDDY